MDDAKIVDMYWARDEKAIKETNVKYGRYCYQIAYNILYNEQDADESVNDTYLGAWNCMPPHRPMVLATFLGKITRRISLNRWRMKKTQKRGGGETALALGELMECIPSNTRIDDALEAEELGKVINKFLDTLPITERRLFICRYWYLDSINDLCNRFGFSQSKVKSMLYRTREKLLVVLEKEGIFV